MVHALRVVQPDADFWRDGPEDAVAAALEEKVGDGGVVGDLLHEDGTAVNGALVGLSHNRIEGRPRAQCKQGHGNLQYDYILKSFKWRQRCMIFEEKGGIGNVSRHADEARPT